MALNNFWFRYRKAKIKNWLHLKLRWLAHKLQPYLEKPSPYLGFHFRIIGSPGVKGVREGDYIVFNPFCSGWAEGTELWHGSTFLMRMHFQRDSNKSKIQIPFNAGDEIKVDFDSFVKQMQKTNLLIDRVHQLTQEYNEYKVQA